MSTQSLTTGYDGKYIVWGCGMRGKYFYQLLHHKIDFAYFIDKNPQQPYFEERNIEVKTPALATFIKYSSGKAADDTSPRSTRLVCPAAIMSR